MTERTVLSVGDTEIVLLPTPGHTPGTLSAFAPVQVDGQRRMASFWGGKGMRPDAASTQTMIRSLGLFAEESERLGVDIPLNTHSWGDATISRIIDLVLVPDRPNPFVLTQAQARGNLEILERCTSAYLDAVKAGAVAPRARD